MDNPNKPSCEQIIDTLPDPFVVIDRNYRIAAANRSYCEHYGVKRGTVVGRRCFEVSHHLQKPCGQAGEHCPLEEVLLRKRDVDVMHVHFDRQGNQEHVQLHASPLLDADGEVRYIGETIHCVDAPEDDEHPIIVGHSRPLLNMTNLLQRVAPTDTTVLLLGESGVGKERAAEYLHLHSRRADRTLIVVDCGALGADIIESELFGYEKGAFTGATQRKRGLIEAADGGTLFIDEIGELPLSLQTKLLRALETGSIRRLGGTAYTRVDVRIIAASNRDIAHMVKTETFRADLYYRLSAFPVVVPALRERKDDIAVLSRHFLASFEEHGRSVRLSLEAAEQLIDYDYPGNVRELRNIIERASILAADGVIYPEHLVFGHGNPAPEVAGEGTGTLFDRRRIPAQDIIHALDRYRGHRGRTAHYLGISERTLYRYLRSLRDMHSDSPLD